MVTRREGQKDRPPREQVIKGSYRVEAAASGVCLVGVRGALQLTLLLTRVGRLALYQSGPGTSGDDLNH